jgi:hypothetical protein
LHGTAGYRYRMFRGDAKNFATNGAWLYLKFTT